MAGETNTVRRKRGRPAAAATPFRMPTDLLGFNIVRLAHLKRNRDDALFKTEIGIGLNQFGLLMLLAGQPGLGAGQLARWLLITPQSIARLLSELVARGLVKRESEIRRGARIRIHLAPKGRKALARGQLLIARTEAEVRLRLSADEAATLNRLLVQSAEYYADLARSDQSMPSDQCIKP